MVAQRSERKLIEAAGEKGWRERVGGASGLQGLIRNDGISDLFKNISDGILDLYCIYYYLFIHDGMQPGSYGPLEKQIKCLERESTNNPKVMPSSPMNKCKMQK